MYRFDQDGCSRSGGGIVTRAPATAVSEANHLVAQVHDLLCACDVNVVVVVIVVVDDDDNADQVASGTLHHLAQQLVTANAFKRRRPIPVN